MSKIVMTVNTNADRNRNKALASGIDPMDFFSEKTIGDFYVSTFLDAHTIEYNGERVHAITFIDDIETGYTDLILRIEMPGGIKELKLNKYAETFSYKFLQVKIELRHLAETTEKINSNTRVFKFTDR